MRMHQTFCRLKKLLQVACAHVSHNIYQKCKQCPTETSTLPQWLHVIHVSNQYLVINSCSEMLRLKEVNTVEVCNIDTSSKTNTNTSSIKIQIQQFINYCYYSQNLQCNMTEDNAKIQKLQCKGNYQTARHAYSLRGKPLVLSTQYCNNSYNVMHFHNF